MFIHEKQDDAAAFRELIGPSLEQAGIVDPEDVALMKTDELTRDMFMKNFTDNEGNSMDPGTFLRERLDAKKGAVRVEHRGILPEDMVSSSESWHTDNRDNLENPRG